MKTLLLIGTLYGLLFSFFSIAHPDTTTNQKNVYWRCDCYEEDIFFDDFAGTVRLIEPLNIDINRIATETCQVLYGNYWSEMRVSECFFENITHVIHQIKHRYPNSTLVLLLRED